MSDEEYPLSAVELTEIFQAAPEFKGTTTKFEPVGCIDTISREGKNVNINTQFVCITAMDVYEDKSLEELRAEDYECSKVAVYRNPLLPAVTNGILLDPKLLAATTSSNKDSLKTAFKEAFPCPNSSTAVQPWSQNPFLHFGTSQRPSIASSVNALTTGATSSVGSLVAATTAFSQPLKLGGFNFQPASTSEPSVTAKATTNASSFSGFSFGKALQSENSNTTGAASTTPTFTPLSVGSSLSSASSSAPTTLSTFSFSSPLTSLGTAGVSSDSTSCTPATRVSRFRTTSSKRNFKFKSPSSQGTSVESTPDDSETGKSGSVFDLGYNSIRRTVEGFWKGKRDAPEDTEIEERSPLASVDDSSGIKLADMFQLLQVMKETKCDADDVVKLVHLAKTMKEADVTATDLADLKDYYQKPS